MDDSHLQHLSVADFDDWIFATSFRAGGLTRRADSLIRYPVKDLVLQLSVTSNALGDALVYPSGPTHAWAWFITPEPLGRARDIVEDPNAPKALRDHVRRCVVDVWRSLQSEAAKAAAAQNQARYDRYNAFCRNSPYT